LVGRRSIALAVPCVLCQKLVALRAPLVKTIFLTALFQVVAADILCVQCKGLISLDRNLGSRFGIMHPNLALPHHQLQRIGIDRTDTKTSRLPQNEIFVLSVYLEGAFVVIRNSKFGFALVQIDGRDGRALAGKP